MKVLVAIKKVIDPYVKVRVVDNQIQTQNLKTVINPFDEIALEAAIRLKEQHKADEIIAVSVGIGVQEIVRQALALGADRGIIINTNHDLCSLNIAKILKKITEQQSINLVLLGKQSIDGDNNQVPQMLASLLDWPQVTYASAITLEQEKLNVTRETDQGLEILELDLPAVISADLRLNTPRYLTLPNIMKAKQKSIVSIELDALNLDLKEHQQKLTVRTIELKKAAVTMISPEALAEQLHRMKIVS